MQELRSNADTISQYMSKFGTQECRDGYKLPLDDAPCVKELARHVIQTCPSGYYAGDGKTTLTIKMSVLDDEISFFGKIFGHLFGRNTVSENLGVFNIDFPKCDKNPDLKTINPTDESSSILLSNISSDYTKEDAESFVYYNYQVWEREYPSPSGSYYESSIHPLRNLGLDTPNTVSPKNEITPPSNISSDYINDYVELFHYYNYQLQETEYPSPSVPSGIYNTQFSSLNSTAPTRLSNISSDYNKYFIAATLVTVLGVVLYQCKSYIFRKASIKPQAANLDNKNIANDSAGLDISEKESNESERNHIITQNGLVNTDKPTSTTSVPEATSVDGYFKPSSPPPTTTPSNPLPNLINILHDPLDTINEFPKKEENSSSDHNINSVSQLVPEEEKEAFKAFIHDVIRSYAPENIDNYLSSNQSIIKIISDFEMNNFAYRHDASTNLEFDILNHALMRLLHLFISYKPSNAFIWLEYIKDYSFFIKDLLEKNNMDITYNPNVIKKSLEILKFIKAYDDDGVAEEAILKVSERYSSYNHEYASLLEDLGSDNSSEIFDQQSDSSLSITGDAAEYSDNNY